ncbi:MULTISPECIES: fatty acid desaturase [unclassified Novosphingobium]|uniref:fatty acid desaturase family protein n=1 Tax=unclassified Novosphingobium TaxID=2644732 RepID=UPI000D4F4AB4|nr:MULTISPECIES: fatty acid desaturase [unclassified Novosphingobium]PTR11549.1 fatty acid desaturase [Novosphingobium sp. GV055]PUB04330.1 fatty acid desaturase [Novosphingobium sp. GV061]PUB20721.1 fatty acid desaturase [Novosphingobium sp. GV079]PUB42447.1 fatty acid desaturase [Novosphingobium sp. GV027]
MLVTEFAEQSDAPAAAASAAPAATLPAATSTPAHRAPGLAGTPEDKEMLRAAAELTRDIARARPEIYWPDMLVSALLGYGALGLAIATALRGGNWGVVVALGVFSALALYRALLFIHELTHMHRDALPGFRFVWNLVVGIPVLMPSFMYEGVHSLHHSRIRYGTSEDPEYLPLALMKPWSLPLFTATALLLPVGLLLRSAVLVPLGVIVPPLRTLVWERASSLSINPGFRRRKPEGAMARMVFWQELGATLWAWAVLGWSATHGWLPLLIALGVIALAALLNQVRTLVAHLWENEGEQMTVTGQYLDSVNVPPPGVWGAMWAPVGLRYHALHHLLPSMPYHSLAECHRRLRGHLGLESTYERANYAGLFPLLARLVRSTMGTRAKG